MISSRKISLIRLGENSTSGEYSFQGGLPTELAQQRNASALIIQTCAAPHVVEKAASRARREGLKVLGSLTKPVSVGRLNQLLQAYQMPCFNTLAR